jgi:hypothetical protein
MTDLGHIQTTGYIYVVAKLLNTLTDENDKQQVVQQLMRMYASTHAATESKTAARSLNKVNAGNEVASR